MCYNWFYTYIHRAINEILTDLKLIFDGWQKWHTSNQPYSFRAPDGLKSNQNSCCSRYSILKPSSSSKPIFARDLNRQRVTIIVQSNIAMESPKELFVVSYSSVWERSFVLVIFDVQHLEYGIQVMKWIFLTSGAVLWITLTPSHQGLFSELRWPLTSGAVLWITMTPSHQGLFSELCWPHLLHSTHRIPLDCTGHFFGQNTWSFLCTLPIKRTTMWTIYISRENCVIS